jgi:WD40 repeat protein
MDYSKQAASLKLVRIPLILAGLVFAAALAFTPRPASTASSGAPVRQTGAWQATLVLTHTNIVDSVAWSPDGSKIAAGDRDGNLRVWDAATGASMLTMSGHDGDVTSVAWSSDGSKIATVTDGSDNAAAPWHGSVLIWDAATGANLHTLTGHTARLDSVSWSPDGTKVVSASPIDESVRVWDAATGANLLTLTLPSASNNTSVAWSPDGAKLASTTNDKSILVWDSVTGDTLLTLTGDTGTPAQLAWSPDGSKIAAGSYDRHLRVWDAATGDNLLTIKQDGVVGSVAWSPDGSKIASRMSDADTGSPGVNVWDATTGAALQTWPTDSSYTDVLWSPDGGKIATATWDGKILIWDAVTGANLALLSDHGREVSAMGWSPDGSRLASGSADMTVRVWAAAAPATGTPTSTPEPAATPASTPTGTPAPTATPSSTPTGTPDPNALAFEPPSLEFVWVKGSRNPASQAVLARNASGKTGWHPSSWANDSGTKWVPGGLQMNISVSPASANLDVGVHESQFVLNSNGMTITLPVKVTVVSPDGKLEVNRKQLNFGGFVGDPIAGQVVGLTFTGLNSANWTASGPPWLTLTPASGSVAATAPSSLTVGIDAAAISAAGRYTGALTVSDGKTTHEIAVDLSQVAPGSPTIQLFGLEVTQGIQNLLNDVPFVAERPVFVRGHVRSLTGQPIEKVTAQLTGTRDGVDLGTLNPTNPGGAINIVADPNRARLNESFLFELPSSWRTGTVTLRLAGQSQPIACVDPAEKSSATAAADDCTVSLTYETIPALPIKYFLYSEQGSITYSGGGQQSSMTFTANANHAAATSQQLLAGLPIPQVDPQIHGTVLTFPGVRDGAAQSRMDRIMAAEHDKAGKPSIHFYGLFARYKPATDPNAQVQGGPGGVAVVPGFSGFGEYYTFQPMETLNMHEIGHNLGRSHVGCAAPGLPYPANPDSAYPYPDQRISDKLSGDEAYYGFNIVDRDIYPPTYKDYMSYCWPKWISPYTYKAMMERLKIHYNPPAGDSGAGQAAASPGSPLLLVSGSISGATAGSIDSVVDDTAGAAISAPDASDYSVRLEDAGGQTIATYPVTPQLAQGQDHEDLVGYTLAVSRPETLARVVLLYQDQELAARAASANAPALTLTAPAGGESLDSQPLAITWDASDADGDALTFSVDYSIDDGATWQKLAWGWPETTLEVDGARLPGAAQARIRVAANDGFLTAFAVSEPFTVADHPPVATILTTNLNRYYVGGQTILLEGAGYDAEDGMVSDLTWHSDREGVLGTGPTLSLNADDLVEGMHLIRLEATDSTGQSSFGDPALGIASADSVAVNDTVSFDVLYDPLTLPAEPAVARIQAESGVYAGDAASSDIYGGFDGTGFAAYLTAAESAVQLDANAVAAGIYDLSIRYAAGPDGPETDRTISLYVNGSKLRQLAFGRTFDWAEWADLATSIDLNAGDNTIEFRVDSDDTGYINIDYIDYVAGEATSGEATSGEATSGEPAAPESQVEDAGALPEPMSTDGAPAAEAAEEPTPEAPAQADGFPLRPGQTVAREQKIPSESGNHYLIFQPDSNVVVYTADDQYVWGLQSITDRYAEAQSVQMENDGNFVVRDANGEHIWSALNENPDPSAYLTLTPEGVLQLVSGDTEAILWASDGAVSAP